MSVLIDQLNRDNDVLYMIGDIVTKFNKETERNKQIYNGIVNDLNCIFDSIDITKIFKSIHTQRYSNVRIVNVRIVNDIYISTNNTSRLRKLVSGYKYYHYNLRDRVQYPVPTRSGRYGKYGRYGYMGCSYIKINLPQKYDRAIKNYAEFFDIKDYQYDDIKKKVRKHKAGIEAWYDCQY